MEDAGMSPADAVAHEILDRLGLLPDSDPPNSEPDYEARLRKLGATLTKRDLSGPECLFALALHLCEARSDDAESVGLARVLATAGRNLIAIEGRAIDIGTALLKSAADASSAP